MREEGFRRGKGSMTASGNGLKEKTEKGQKQGPKVQRVRQEILAPEKEHVRERGEVERV